MEEDMVRMFVVDFMVERFIWSRIHSSLAGVFAFVFAPSFH